MYWYAWVASPVLAHCFNLFFPTMWTNVCLLQVQNRLSKAKSIQMVTRLRGGASDFSKQVFKPKKLFSTVFLTDDAFSALAHNTDGISCFCWLKLQNPIGSLNPIKRFIFSDALLKFFNYDFWILSAISILRAKPFMLSLCSSRKWHELCTQYIFSWNYHFCYCCTRIPHKIALLMYCTVVVESSLAVISPNTAQSRRVFITSQPSTS